MKVSIESIRIVEKKDGSGTKLVSATCNGASYIVGSVTDVKDMMVFYGVSSIQQFPEVELEESGTATLRDGRVVKTWRLKVDTMEVKK